MVAITKSAEGERSNQSDGISEAGAILAPETEVRSGKAGQDYGLRKYRRRALGRDNTVFDEALKVAWKAKRNFHDKGFSSSDQISKPSVSLSKVGESSYIPVGSTTTLRPKNVETFVEEEIKYTMGKQKKTKSIGELCGSLHSTNSRTRKLRKLKNNNKFVGHVFEKEQNNTDGPQADYFSPKSIPVAMQQGETPAVFDTLRCNHSILSNFDFPGDEKLQCFISKLGG